MNKLPIMVAIAQRMAMYGWTYARMAQATGKDPATVSRHFSDARAPAVEDVRDYLRALGILEAVEEAAVRTVLEYRD